MPKKLKAEKREEKKKRKIAKNSATLAGQKLRMKTVKNYQGDVKKIK